jgi:hypothetical protein
MAFLYKPTSTGLALHESDAFFKGVVGPYASGKSTAMAMDILYNAMAQPPDSRGVRHSRWGVVRAGYPNLQSTRKTLLEVMPEGTGGVNMAGAPVNGLFRFPLPDGTRVQIEFELWSAKTGEDAKKFKSCNWTGCWINEATEVSRDVVLMAMNRAERFPVEQDGGCRWGGVIMDFNHPSADHWVKEFFAVKSMSIPDPDTGLPRTYSLDLFRQPPAAFRREVEGRIVYDVNPAAENLENLSGGVNYYARQVAAYQMAGKLDDLDGLYCMLDVASMDGRPVWPMFKPEIHVASWNVEPVKTVPVVVGFDTSGIHPAAVVGQFWEGKWRVTDEIDGDQEGLESFLNAGLLPLLRARYKDSPVVVSVDPANARDGFTGVTPANHLEEAGLKVHIPFTNRPETRVAAVATRLNRLQGSFLISPVCKRLIAALRGGYRYAKRRLRGSIDVLYSDKPEKNEYSHLADALQYLALFINREDRGVSLEAMALRRRQAEHNGRCARLM